MIDDAAWYWLWVIFAVALYVGYWFLDTGPISAWDWIGYGWVAFPPPKLQYPVTSPPTPPVV